MKDNKNKIINIVILVLIIAFLCYLTVQLFPIFKDLSTETGRLEFKDKIEGLGTKGVFMIIGLMVTQVFLPILPGEPVEVLSGMCFGSIGGLIVVILGALISTFIIIVAVRKLGKKFIYTFVAKEKIDKLENNKIFKNPKKIDFIIFLLFFIPGTPKDLFVYIGALLPINPWKFVFISSFARFPSIISSTIAGANLVSGNWGMIIGVYAITFAISAILIYVFGKKNPSIKEVM